MGRIVRTWELIGDSFAIFLREEPVEEEDEDGGSKKDDADDDDSTDDGYSE